MTQQEIIDFLKKNKETGIAFAFMPKEVRDWINDPSRKIVYLIFKSGSWEDLPIEATANEEDIFALPDSFQIQQEPQGECKKESEHKCIADSMLLAASVIKSNCIKTKCCDKCVLFRNEECLLNTHPGYWDLIQL